MLTTAIDLGPATMLVDLALSAEDHGRGLQDRIEPLARPMLFVFPQAARWPFHNLRTPARLDLATFDARGQLLRVTPMRSSLETHGLVERYEPPEPFLAALEAPRGLLARLGVQPGDRLRVQA